MKIPEHILKDIQSMVSEELEGIYNKYVYKPFETEFSSLVKEKIDKAVKHISKLQLVDAETMESITNRRTQTKKRWVKKELDDAEKIIQSNDTKITLIVGSYYAEVLNTPYNVWKTCKETNNTALFKQFYNYDTFEMFKAQKRLELEQWRDSQEALVSKFPYIQTKKPTYIKKAIENDILYLIYKVVKERCPRGEQNLIAELPRSLVKIPIDFTNKKQFPDEVIPIGEKEYYVDKYYIDDDTVFESHVNAEILTSEIYKNTMLKVFNSLDRDVYEYVLEQRDANFYKNRTISVDIGDIVKAVYSGRGKNDYDNVKRSLYKMSSITPGAIDKNLRGFTTGIFDNVKIQSETFLVDKNGKEKYREVAKITVNEDIVNEYVKDTTIKLYKEEINNFKSKYTRLIVFPLQMERVALYTSTKKNENLKTTVTLSYFKGILYFPNYSRKRIVKMIAEALEELKDNKVVIKSYKPDGDNFILEFIPMSPQEKWGLIKKDENTIEHQPID